MKLKDQQKNSNHKKNASKPRLKSPVVVQIVANYPLEKRLNKKNHWYERGTAHIKYPVNGHMKHERGLHYIGGVFQEHRFFF